MTNHRKVINGRAIANSIIEKLKPRISRLKKQGMVLKLGVILVGDNRESKIYIQKKQLACARLGIQFALKKYPASISTKKLSREITKFQKQRLGGLIIQLPLPKRIKKSAILNAIKPRCDVDCLNSENLGKLSIDKALFLPPAVAAIMEIGEREKINWRKMKIIIVGKGELVGKPLSQVFNSKQIKFTVVDKLTKNVKEKIKLADIIISAVGKPHLITPADIKKGATVIDVATTWQAGKLYGDVDWKEALNVVKRITPVPGGVGPITVSMLLANIVKSAEMAYSKHK